jgi:hypothetical protein
VGTWSSRATSPAAPSIWATWCCCRGSSMPIATSTTPAWPGSSPRPILHRLDQVHHRPQRNLDRRRVRPSWRAGADAAPLRHHHRRRCRGGPGAVAPNLEIHTPPRHFIPRDDRRAQPARSACHCGETTARPRLPRRWRGIGLSPHALYSTTPELLRLSLQARPAPTTGGSSPTWRNPPRNST